MQGVGKRVKQQSLEPGTGITKKMKITIVLS
ncbi:MAG: hypothetical protein LPK03_02505 [Pontibacter sp.]|nr:hypothetical protein [Pontibacter sp.]